MVWDNRRCQHRILGIKEEGEEMEVEVEVDIKNKLTEMFTIQRMINHPMIMKVTEGEVNIEVVVEVINVSMTENIIREIKTMKLK
jgi:N12 class adenine-specific DNA methylase